MILTIDIGNSGITLGVFDKQNIIKTAWLKADINLSQKDYQLAITKILHQYKFEKCIISSVYDEITDRITNAAEKSFNIKPYILTHNSKCGITLDVDKPESVGADRIANVCAAYQKYSTACIIIDIGTATTFDIVNSKGKFTGGVIMPGIKMQLKALHNYTSKLPLIDFEIPQNYTCKNTKDAILVGVVSGHCKAIEGLIKTYRAELNEPAKVILTGGLAKQIANYIAEKEINSNKT